MTIYTSEKVMPYVYMGIHKETGQFYIGSRHSERRKLPSHLDILQYRTSSRRVRPQFDRFDWFILAEFFTGEDAVRYEQQLIHEHWGNPLLINGSCIYGDVKLFSSTSWGEGRRKALEKLKGRQGRAHSHETRQKISRANTGRVLGERSPEHRKKISQAKTGLKFSEQHRNNMSKQWLVTDPSGGAHIITNLAQFCIEHALSSGCMLKVAQGKQRQHRGWRCAYLCAV